MPLCFSKSAHSRGSTTVAQQDVAGAHLHFPDLHTWQHEVNHGSWWLLSSENSTQRYARQNSEPLLWEDQCWRAQSSSSTTSQLPNPSSLYTGSLCGMLLQVHPRLVSQSVGMFWQHVKVFGCQWDKVNSAEVLKKILKVHSLSSILLSRREYGWSRQRTMGRHWGRSYSENCVVIRQLFWSKSPLEINILWCITAINFVSSK